ncbi:unnamed protein product, partial [marine sediment metagenome]
LLAVAVGLWIARSITRPIRALTETAEERQRLLSSVVEQSSAGIAIADREGNLLFLNKVFAALHGYTPEELKGEHLSIFHTADQMPAVEAANRELQETGEFSGEIDHVRRDGSVFTGHVRNSIIRGEAANQTLMVSTLRDVSERKRWEARLAEKQAQLDAFFNSAQAGMVVFDEELRIQQINHAAAAFTGMTADEFLGKRISDMLPEQLASQIEASLRRVLETGQPDEYGEVSGRIPNQPGVTHHWTHSHFPIRAQDGR